MDGPPRRSGTAQDATPLHPWRSRETPPISLPRVLAVPGRDPGNGPGHPAVLSSSHHVMAGLVPAIPIRKSAAPHTIGITGTGPVMTRS
jgi:hypothetical protein